ncbi:phosphorylase family protein [Bacillus sp. AK128]
MTDYYINTCILTSKKPVNLMENLKLKAKKLWDKVPVTMSLKEILIKEYSPACVEMEGSAIGHVAYMNEVPLIIIHCISDLADEEAGMSYEKFEEIAGERSALVVVGMVELI